MVGRVTSKLIISETIGRMRNLSTLSQATFPRVFQKSYANFSMSNAQYIIWFRTLKGHNNITGRVTKVVPT